MKRDARLGLAVILVLGLALTMLVARSLHKRADQLDADEESDRAAAQARKLDQEKAKADGFSGGPGVSGSGVTTASAVQPGASSDESPEAAAQRAEVARFNSDHSPLGAQGAQQQVCAVGANRANALNPNQPNYSGADMTDLSGDTHQDFAVEPQSDHKLTGYVYKWQTGDSPAKVSEKIFGAVKYTSNIQGANPSVKWEHIKVGQKITIPVIKNAPPKMELEKVFATSSTEAHAVQTPHTASVNEHVSNIEHAATGSAQSYTVQSGDTLAKIATQFYGSSGPKAIKKLQDANPGLDPRKMKVGMNLKVPAAS